jgi:hypothetical protein
MKIPTPSPYRSLILYRVICASEAAKEFVRMPQGGFPQAKLQEGLTETGLNATLAEFTLLVQSLYEIFSLDMTSSLTSVRASTPFNGLTVEREVELLKEVASRKLIQKIAGKKDFPKIFAEVKENKSYVAVGITRDELAYVLITAMNEYAARFEAEVKEKYEEPFRDAVAAEC